MLVAVGDKRDELCLIDIKEAMTAIAPHAPKAAMPKDNAGRVHEGAKYLSPALGNRLLPAHLGDKPVFLRELLPQDLKLEIETLTVDDAEGVARFLAYVVGRAHARQMDDDARQEWRKQLAANRSKQLAAPSWLWSSVVSLMITHEGGVSGALQEICDGGVRLAYRAQKKRPAIRLALPLRLKKF